MRRAFTTLILLALSTAGAALPATSAAAVDPPRVRVTPGASGVVLGGTRPLTATVTGLANTAVTWSVRRGPGSVDTAGVYAPPALLPPDPVAVVRAASAEDPTIFGEAVVTIASGVPAAGFAPHVAVTGGAYKTRTGDVTGDGLADIVRLQGLANDIKTFQFVTMSSNGSGGFTESTSPVGSVYTKPDGFTQTSDFVGDFEIADVDGDGDNDLVIAFGSSSTSTYRYQVFRNNGTGTWTPDAKVLADPSGARSGATMKLTDFDGDGHLDMVRLDTLASVVLQKGDGTGAFGTSISLFSASGGRYLDVGDLTGDGRPEVLVGTQTTAFAIERAYKVAVNDGFGNIAAETTYTVGLNPDPFVYDVDGDGWNDLVVAIGGDGATNDPPKLVAQLNLGTGTGAVGAATQLLAFRPTDLQAVHVDGDGVLDLAGATFRGPFLARRTGPGAFSPVHAGSPFSVSSTATADVTGDGRVDVYGAQDRESRFWPGSDDGTFAFAFDSGPSYVNATQTGVFTVATRNSPVPVQLQFTASRGTFASSFFQTSSATYTAPTTASSAGTPVRITATIAAIPATVTRDIVVANDSYQQFAIGTQQVRQVVADPVLPQTLYAATSSGVFRSENNGASFTALGATNVTGTDARQVAVSRSGDTARLLAVFASTLYRYDFGTAEWTAAGVSTAASVSAVPSSLVAYAAGGGQVHRTTDGGLTWAPLGGTQVQEVDAIDADRVWVRRASAPRVNVGTVADGVMALAARDLPAGFAMAVSPRPADRATAYVTTSDSPYRLYRGDAATGTWTALVSPGFVDNISESPVTGHLLATRFNTTTLVKSRDGGASWYSAYRGFPNGVHLLAVGHRTDGVDVVGTTSGVYLPVATTPPATPEITSGPTGTTGPGGAGAFSFAFTGSGTSYLCALDDAGWTACTTPKAYSGPLTSGQHTFSVVAVVNGDESVAATRSWTVDATPPPVVTGLTGPAALTNQTTATFTWTMPEGAAGATCSLNGATPVACASGVQHTGLAQGARTFAVRTVDEYGNASAPVTHSWTIDTTPPTYPHFWTGPSWRQAGGSAFFQWPHDATATYVCTLDAQPVACGAGNYSVSGLAEGEHTFGVTASDGAGNTSANGRQWYTDLTPPAAPLITVRPPESTDATTAYFEFESPDDDVSYYWCNVDGMNYSCYGDHQVNGLGVGPHTFSVQAIDDAGQLGPEATYAWTVTPPAPPGAPSITGGPSGLVTTKTAAFTYDVGSGNTAKCSLDGAEPAACPVSGITYENVADGPHTFAVYAVRSGILSAAATRTWTVDTTPPAMPALTSAPAARTKATTATFAWTAVEGLVYTCRLDGVAVGCPDGGYAATGLAEGAHEFTLKARDAAGHDSPVNTHAWTVDVTGALPVIDAKPAAVTGATSAAFAVSSQAPDFAHFTCTVDGVPVDCSDGTVEVTVAPGAHQFRVVGHDDLGNGTPVTYDWVVDTAAPAAALLTKPAAVTKTTVASFTWTAEAGVTYACALDAAEVPCGDGSYTSGPLAEGPHTFALTASDEAGNDSEPATHAWTVDTTAPVVTIGTQGPSITAARVVSFGEPVAGVSATTVRLLLTGTTTRVPVALLCRDAAAAPVSCAAGGVRSVVVTPIAPLVPGQLYTLSASGLADLAGNAAAAKTAAFRASVSEEESTPAAKAAWRRVSLSGTQGGWYSVARLKGASATYAFTGTGIGWYAVRGKSFGTADVYVDGVLKLAKVSFYSSTTGPVYKSIGGLTNAKHTLKIVVRGEKGSSAGTGTDVAVDAFKVGSAVSASPPATYAWASRAATAASGKAYALEDYAGTTYTFTFRGRGVDWVTVLGPNMGKATVRIDGVVKGTYDNWASATRYGALRSFTGLADKVHTLSVTVLGQRRSGATGSYVAVDRFGVRP